MLFPLLAQADDSAGAQYTEATPTATGTGKGIEAPVTGTASNDKGGSTGSTETGGTGPSSPEGESAGGTSNGSGTGAKTTGDGGTGSDGKQGGTNASKPNQAAGQPSGSKPEAVANQSSSDDGGGSSPLVPILIAIAVLAAISIGAVVVRQRRGPGAPVSPNAN